MTAVKLSAGFAKVDITPNLGCQLSGFVARQGLSQTVHDPLWARAFVVTDGLRKLAVVMADVIGFDSAFVQSVRTRIGRVTDLEPECIIVGAIHTHSGPVTVERGFLGQPDPDYLETLQVKITAAVTAAEGALQPVRIFAGESECLIGKNRRHQDGPTDSTVSVVYFETDLGHRTIWVNYACHPVVLGPDNLAITADYPYYMIKSLEKLYPDSEILFTNGATGDVNVGHNASDSIRGGAGSKRTFGEAERLGKILADAVGVAIRNAASQDASELKFQNAKIVLPYEKVLGPQDYGILREQYHVQAAKLEKSGHPWGEIRQAEVWAEWAAAMEQQIENEQVQPGILTEVSAFSIGNLKWVTFPGEFFHELGMKIRHFRQGQPVMILGYCNDTIGYVAPESAYPEGGYEIEDSYRYYGLPSKLKKGAGGQVVATLWNMMRMLDS